MPVNKMRITKGQYSEVYNMLTAKRGISGGAAGRSERLARCMQRSEIGEKNFC